VALYAASMRSRAKRTKILLRLNGGRTARWRRAAGATLWLCAAGCGPEPFDAPNPFRDQLLRTEKTLSDTGVGYADYSRSAHFNPEGLYLEGDTLWVWSRAQPIQRGLRRMPQASFRVAAERRGPLATRRCIVGAGVLTGATFCLGEHQPRGITTFGALPFDPELPARAGYRDLALDPRHGFVYVVDSVDDRLWTLDARGRARASLKIPAAAYRLGIIDEGWLFLLAGTDPRLSLITLDGNGIPTAVGAKVPLIAPVRDAAWDAARGWLWTVGPEQAGVRRSDGLIRHLGSEVRAHPLDRLLAGSAEPALRFDLAEQGLLDGTHIAAGEQEIVVAATGSDALWRARAKDGRFELARSETGLGPQGVLLLDDGVVVASRLEDSVRFHIRGGASDCVVLDDAARQSDRDLGERLFYGRFLYGETAQTRFTCNSCHWDTGTDHRIQPGFRESRFELTRPLGAIGSVAPIFSTLGAPSLTDAIEGLIRGLDARFGEGHVQRDAYWLHGLTLQTKGGENVPLSALAVRRALLTFLMTLPAEPGPLHAAGKDPSEEAARGFSLFARDCMGCHEPARDMRRRDRVPTESVLAEAEREPLVFGAPLFARTGVEPTYTPDGNRVSPLHDLGRGGPFFSNGSAATLGEVLGRSRPGTALVHGSPTGVSAYSDAELSALRTFLLSL